MSDSTGTAAPGDDGDLDREDDLEPADAVPAGGLSGGTAVATRPARRGPVTRVRGIGTFYRQVVAELRKVIWPTRNELVTYTTVVVVFVVVMVAIVSVFDFAFSQAVLKVFGDSSL
ncbi:MAG: preprotein translocase, SecE subunit [Frankiales bacterium]|nr:preprotein translocase, SecE subunit [Frankiales bacterium]